MKPFDSGNRLYLILAAYFAVVYLLRGFLFPGAAFDDAEELLFSQSLQWGYAPENPPLYTWLVIASQAVFGISVPSVVLVRSTLLFLSYVLLHRASLLVLGDARLALLATLSQLAIPFVAWRLVKTHTHSVVLVVSCIATFYALMLLERSPRRRWYLALGGVVGLGMLSKYNYLVFAASLLVAALGDRRLRRRILDRRALLTLGVVLGAVLPHVLWNMENLAWISAKAQQKFAVLPSSQEAVGVLPVVGKILGSVFSLSALLLLLLLVFFGKAFFRRTPERDAGTASAGRHAGLLGRSLGVQLGVVLLLSLGFKVTNVQTHHFLIFILLPLWLFSRIRDASVLSSRASRSYVAMLCVLAAAAPLLVVEDFLFDTAYRVECSLHVDYRGLALELRNAGFDGGTILTRDPRGYVVSGNLRPLFPESRIMNRANRKFEPGEPTRFGKCLLVWSAEATEADETELIEHARRRFDFQELPESTTGTVALPLVRGRGRSVGWSYRLFPEGVGSCR